MPRTAHLCLRAISFCAALAFALPAHARIGLVIGEPFGSFGTMLPVGHASIYLDNLCAASPTQLRPCHPGESGVIIARYHDLKSQHLDWLAIPAFTFFYGVNSPDQVPTYVTPHLEAELRESYRQANLLDILPARIDKHGNPHAPPYGDWEEGIGSAFDRNLLLYTIRTTPQQDAQLLDFINNDPNRRRYNLGRYNCADFAANLLKVIVPGLPHRNIAADFDITTPKNLARRLDAYGRTHPSLDLHVYEIPQIPGTLRRSRPFRGSAELLLKTKRYFFTLMVLQPEIALTDWIAYEARGRWTPGLDATHLSPYDWNIRLTTQTVQAATQNPVKPPTPSENANPPINTGEITSQKLAY